MRQEQKLDQQASNAQYKTDDVPTGAMPGLIKKKARIKQTTGCCWSEFQTARGSRGLRNVAGDDLQQVCAASTQYRNVKKNRERRQGLQDTSYALPLGACENRMSWVSTAAAMLRHAPLNKPRKRPSSAVDMFCTVLVPMPHMQHSKQGSQYHQLDTSRASQKQGQPGTT